MKVFLDECVDRRLSKFIEGFEVRTVSEMGWSGIKNGELLTLAQEKFDAFLTVDRNLAFQQNIPRYTIAVVMIESPSNRLADLLGFIPQIRTALTAAPRGCVTRIRKSEERA